jgi:hypothetical protein
MGTSNISISSGRWALDAVRIRNHGKQWEDQQTKSLKQTGPHLRVSRNRYGVPPFRVSKIIEGINIESIG